MVAQHERMIANKLKKLGFFHHMGLDRTKPPKPESQRLVIDGWYFAEGITGVWAYRSGSVFLSQKVSLTESLKVQIFELFKIEVEEKAA